MFKAQESATIFQSLSENTNSGEILFINCLILLIALINFFSNIHLKVRNKKD